MDYAQVHKKWAKFWQDNGTNKFRSESKKPKYYALEMFPYPSGANLHMGHFFNFAPADTHARFKRMTGFEVFHPMGFDAFGLPAENHALKTGTHPHDNTLVNMEKFKEQLDQLGSTFDWDYSLTSCFPEYYRWTQWLFVELFNAGLAYQKKSPVNWCSGCNTVIANEQVVDEKCERCSSPVAPKQMKQWFFKITDYAEKLLAGLDKVDFPEGTKLMQTNWIGKKTKKVKGEIKTTYRLRDWSVSRQRYWGAPIPIVYCKKCGTVAVPQSELPVMLPKLDDFKPKGAAPLANSEEFVNTTCPKCKGPATREVETMDTFVCSSWYFLRYPSVKDFPNGYIDKADKSYPFCPEITKRLLPVDMYVGGAEHSCGHLLYARFITKVLYDLGHITFDEPFKRLIHQGMILAPDGQKMSKSKGNTVSPDEYIAEFGSDIVRLYMLFGFKYIEGGPWNDNALRGILKFIQRVERVVEKVSTFPRADFAVEHARARTIKSVREDLESFGFNTAVARCMEFLNALEKVGTPPREAVSDLVLLLAPMIPHIAEELWERLGNKPSIFDHPFPTPNENFLTVAEVEIAVQINSKIKSRIIVPTGASQDEVVALADMDGVEVKKIIFVPNKLINFIV